MAGKELYAQYYEPHPTRPCSGLGVALAHLAFTWLLLSKFERRDGGQTANHAERSCVRGSDQDLTARPKRAQSSPPWPWMSRRASTSTSTAATWFVCLDRPLRPVQSTSCAPPGTGWRSPPWRPIKFEGIEVMRSSMPCCEDGMVFQHQPLLPHLTVSRTSARPGAAQAQEQEEASQKVCHVGPCLPVR